MSNPTAHRARKRFGQNFLHDEYIIRRIIESFSVEKEDHIIEIGPGLGAITLPLLEQVSELHVVELDRDLIRRLSELDAAKQHQLHIHEMDALELSLKESFKDQNDLRIIGNLPYNISTPIIFHLLSQISQIKDMMFMLQKEVVDRMAAAAGDKHRGRLSVMVQYYCDVKKYFDVPPGAFNPPPKVVSSIVHLQPAAATSHNAKNDEHLKSIVASAFNQRRKTLRNSLRKLISADLIEATGIDPVRRAETLTVDEFIKLSDQLTSATITRSTTNPE